MKFRSARYGFSVLASVLVLGLPAGCDDGDGGLTNKNPGDNDKNVVACFGDSITMGNMCACTPYPARLGARIRKTVYNSGVNGTTAQESVGRTQEAIDRYHPAFMMILYGVNDMIHGFGAGSTAAAVGQMVDICRQNHVVPVIATYPIPIADHQAFANRTRLLNSHLRNLARDIGVRCVELEKEFNEDPTLYEADGLHPNDAGTQIIAMAFADLF